MGLLDRFRKPVMNLADGTSLQKMPQGGTAEIGVTGQSIIGGFQDEEARVDTLTVDNYVKMRQTDGTTAMLYNVLTLPIASSAYSFKADEADASSEQMDFIEQVLTNPPHKGGMEIPLPLVLADMLRAVLEGFRLYEKVYRVNAEGRIVYRKLAPRDGQTLLLKRSDDGGYGGAHQRVTFKGKYVDVELPAEKTFLYTYGKDKNFLYGESAFKAAYYHYTKVHKLYYLSELSVQASAVPPKVLKGKDSVSQQERNRAMAMMSRFGSVNTAAYIPDGMELTPYNPSTGRVDPMPLIDHHKIEMARSVLAQALTLGGTTGSKGGSYALSKDHTDLLMIGIKAVMDSIEDHINFYVIPDLIDLNFAQPAYPTFHFDDINSETQELVVEAFSQLITKGDVSPEIARGIEDKIAETLEIDRDAIAKVLDKEKADKIAEAKKNGVEVDANGDPLPPPPVVSAPAGDKPAKQPVVNQSDEAADDDPKGLTSLTDGGSEHSHQPRSAFSSLR